MDFLDDNLKVYIHNLSIFYGINLDEEGNRNMKTNDLDLTNVLANTIPTFDDTWMIMLLLLIFINFDKKQDININIKGVE